MPAGRKPDVDPMALREIASLACQGWTGIERTVGGVSTQVYQIRRGIESFYLRVAEERDGSLAPEVLVHRLLRERGVRVPEVTHFEPFNEALERSMMVTTEMPGASVAESVGLTDLQPILVEAGRELAILNGLLVEGFGWIRRDLPVDAPLQADLLSHREFALEELTERLALLHAHLLTSDETRLIEQILRHHDAWLDVERAHLAHGDFDATHIYQLDGRYTGIIDFGEIRGADRLYDLGHFALRDGGTVSPILLPDLLAGYREIAPISRDDECRIQFQALLIGVRALARQVDRSRSPYQAQLVQAIRRSLRALA